MFWKNSCASMASGCSRRFKENYEEEGEVRKYREFQTQSVPKLWFSVVREKSRRGFICV